MRDKGEIFEILSEIDGQPFAEYAKLTGDFDFGRFILRAGHLSPSADDGASVFVVRVPQSVAGFPSTLYNTPVRRTALEDLLLRKLAVFSEHLGAYDSEGIARRRISVTAPGTHILPRSAILIGEEFIEARVDLDLPSRDGAVAGGSAQELFFDDLPGLVADALLYCNLDEAEVSRFVDVMEDADQVRQVLATRGWIGFVPEGVTASVGVDGAGPVLQLPEKLVGQVDVPNAGVVTGMGIPAGVTVVLGGPYSGRIEFMQALAGGIYNMAPGGDGKQIITTADAVYVAGEGGRPVQRVDVSPFLKSAGGEGDVRAYCSAGADTYAGQAAATMEALEVGARALLFDESDSCASFLARDERMSQLLAEDGLLITPLAMRARQMSDELGVSIVVGGNTVAASLIPIADTVLRIENGRIEDVTEEAKELGLPLPHAGGADFSSVVERSRWVMPGSIDASMGRDDAYILATDGLLLFGRTAIELSAVHQIADDSQAETIGLIMHYAKDRYLSEPRSLRELLDLVDRDLSREGLECVTRELRGDLARPRRYEIAAAFNRLPSARMTRPAE